MYCLGLTMVGSLPGGGGAQEGGERGQDRGGVRGWRVGMREGGWGGRRDWQQWQHHNPRQVYASLALPEKLLRM